MLIIQRAVSIIFLVALAACATVEPHQAQTPPPLILISIDGFRPDYMDRRVTPTLLAIAHDGVRGSMHPSFPSVTFPNHYTLVTGLRPDHHGVINNRMEDPSHPGAAFVYSNPELAHFDYWWDEATPIWVTAERHGVHAGTMFWPGSDYPIHGVQASQWRAYDKNMNGDARVDTLLSWFDLPEAQRPRLFTLYFDIVDSAGHHAGPDSEQVNAAAQSVDTSIHRLLDGLASRGLGGRVNIVIVADHGMATAPSANTIDIDAIAQANAARIIWTGPFAGIEPLPGREADLEASLVGRKEHGECWRKDHMPARFHYGTNPRVPRFVCLADIGWRYRTATMPSHGSGADGGDHGYDNDSAEMTAIFLAEGPAFRHGVTLPVFDNVSVYPLLMRLAALPPERNDGNLANTAAALN